MARERISLNGDWDFSFLTASEPPENVPEDITWQAEKFQVPLRLQRGTPHTIDLPGNQSGCGQAREGVAAILLKRIIPIQLEPGQRAWLVLAGIFQRSIYFINGQKAEESSESFLPLEFDISNFVHSGENELVIWCGAYEQIQTSEGVKELAPCGPASVRSKRGPCQEIALEYRPEVSVADAAVRTSIRQQRIEVELTLENRMQMPYTGMLKMQVLDGGTPVKYFQSQSVQLHPRELKTLRLAKHWSGARCWSPDDPYLYQLQICLEQDGKVVDCQWQQFGFREVWLEGSRLMLNGTQVDINGCAPQADEVDLPDKSSVLNWFQLCREAGSVLIRLPRMPYPAFFLEAADETGMLVIDESAIDGSAIAVQADHPIFIENCQDHLRALVRRDRSHPSVILWCIQNEIQWSASNESDQKAISGFRETIQQLDPTRIVIDNCADGLIISKTAGK